MVSPEKHSINRLRDDGTLRGAYGAIVNRVGEYFPNAFKEESFQKKGTFLSKKKQEYTKKADLIDLDAVGGMFDEEGSPKDISIETVATNASALVAIRKRLKALEQSVEKHPKDLGKKHRLDALELFAHAYLKAAGKDLNTKVNINNVYQEAYDNAKNKGEFVEGTKLETSGRMGKSSEFYYLMAHIATENDSKKPDVFRGIKETQEGKDPRERLSVRK